MDIRRLFRSYRYKLLWEGILKSFFFALAAGGLAVFITSLVYHIKTEKTPVALTAWIAGGVFALVFALVFFVFYYPTKKRTACRMDEMGLNERVGTMLQFRHQEGVVIGLQREDAILHIEKSSTRQMKMCSFWKEGTVCGVCLVLACTMLVLPHDLFSVAAEQESVITDEEQAQIIEDLIENLREEIKN